MRCVSKSISPRPCDCTKDAEQITVRDLDSETGTFLNGDRLTDICQLKHGDRLKVGRLEFEVEFTSKSDPVSRYVNELLEEGDEEARLQRLQDPQQRQFHVTPPATQPDAETDNTADAPAETKKPLQRPPKKPPGKLPRPKPIVADNTVDAAAASLERIFQKPKP